MEIVKEQAKTKEPTSLDDLYKLYPTLTELIPQIYEYNRKDIQMTHFELKEMMFEPPPPPKKSEIIEEIEPEISDFKDDLYLKNTASQNSDLDLELSKNSSLDRNEEAKLITDFKYDHRGDQISKQDMDSIIQIIRDGQKGGVNYREEQFMNDQYTTDLFSLQNFIIKKYEESQKKENVDGDLHLHNREEFPTLSALEENSKRSTKKNSKKEVPKNLLEEMKQEKKMNLEKNMTKGLINSLLEEQEPKNVVSQAQVSSLTEWQVYENDQFVLGNVLIYYPVRATGELLQAPQPVSRHNVQQAEVLLQ